MPPQESDIYEVILDKCHVYTPTVGIDSSILDWHYQGFTNFFKPMWAIVVDDLFCPDLVAFVWRTNASRADGSVHQVVGVNCQTWQSRDIFVRGFSSCDPTRRSKVNFLGKTSKRVQDIVDLGLAFTFLQYF
jgi:hypothetical protein